MRLIYAIASMLVFACVALGQSVILPAKAEGGVGVWIVVVPDRMTVEFNLVKWRTSPGLTEVPLDRIFPGAKPQAKVFQAIKSGRYKVEAWVEGDAKLPLDRSSVLTILQDKTLTDSAKIEQSAALLQGISACVVTVGEPGPIPPDPKPPDPKPPDPKPVVPVGFRVLLIHESQEASPAFFDARSVKVYLDAKTVKDGTHPSWRRLDKDQTGVNLPKELRLLWEAAKPKMTTYPAIVIAVNEQVTIHALPKDEAALLALLKQHGGD